MIRRVKEKGVSTSCYKKSWHMKFVRLRVRFPRKVIVVRDGHNPLLPALPLNLGEWEVKSGGCDN